MPRMPLGPPCLSALFLHVLVPPCTHHVGDIILQLLGRARRPRVVGGIIGRFCAVCCHVSQHYWFGRGPRSDFPSQHVEGILLLRHFQRSRLGTGVNKRLQNGAIVFGHSSAGRHRACSHRPGRSVSRATSMQFNQAPFPHHRGHCWRCRLKKGCQRIAG